MNFNDEDIDTIPNPNTVYQCSRCDRCSGMTYLMKLCMMTKKYFHLNDKIDDYLSNNEEEINKQNNHGWTALMLASRNSSTESTEETVKLLLKRNADVNLQNSYGGTALMCASIYSNTDSTEGTVKLLLENNADTNLRDNYRRTALWFASRNRSNNSTEGTVKLLLKQYIKKEYNLVSIMVQFQPIQNCDPLNEYIKKLVIIQHNNAKFI